MRSEKKEQIKTAIAAGIAIILILIAITVVYKYSIEGENNQMPFKLSKIFIGSMIVGEVTEDSSTSTENSIIQNNGIYFEIKKNEDYKKQAIIKSVEIDNIQITKAPIKGEIKTYIPSTKENEKLIYSDEYLLEGNYLKYIGASKSDTTKLEINNQGGLIIIAFGNTNLGKYQLTSEGVTIDGTILKDMDITNEDIKFSVNFDLIINSEGKSFKTNISLDLPTSDITISGKSIMEITDTNKYVFKRI